jgi:hypothetical protein
MPYPNLPEKMWFSPLKMYEYMAAGKAIVACERQITDVIKDGYNGVLVEPATRRSWRSRSACLRSGQEERMAPMPAGS